MKQFAMGCVVGLVLLGAWAVFAQTQSVPNFPVVPNDTAINMSRPCHHSAGGWTTIDCSAGAAYSAALGKWSRYIVQADAGDTRLAWASAGSGQDADGNDGYLPDGAWLEFVTMGSTQYLTCDGSLDGGAGVLRYILCE